MDIIAGHGVYSVLRGGSIQTSGVMSYLTKSLLQLLEIGDFGSLIRIYPNLPLTLRMGFAHRIPTRTSPAILPSQSRD